MALIKCPECGKEISDKASSCPNCGCPLTEKEVEKKYYSYEEEYDNDEYYEDEKLSIVEKIASNPIFIILTILILPPIGLYLMWTSDVPKNKTVRILLTIPIGIYALS